MPLPGGPTDKLGNRYELWWTVDQLERLLHGETQSIRLEPPGHDKVEFVATLGTRHESHQAKRANKDGKWTVRALASDGVSVLQAIHAALDGNDDEFVFVSSSDARGLAELTDRARQSLTAVEFEAEFISAADVRKDLDQVRIAWNGCDIATAHNVLRRLHVRTIDERSLIEKVRATARALFLADPDSVCNELLAFALANVHSAVTRESLIAHLRGRGLTLRRLSDEKHAAVVVDEALTEYLRTARKKLIRGTLIPRAATTKLLGLLGSPAGDGVLVGQAGSGKTACLIEFVEELRKRSVPVLVLRLDRIEPTNTATELGKRLGFEESPVHVLAAAADGREAVLIVDQLDAVSTSSGRSTTFLEAVDDLLIEARGLRYRLPLHIVVVCREFDWNNDHRLKKLLTKGHSEAKVGPFDEDEVKQVLAAAEFDPTQFSKSQLKLLGLAQNLALFLDSDFTPDSPIGFNTAADLFEHYWHEKRRIVNHRAGTDQWLPAINRIVKEMASTQQLSVRRELLDVISTDYLTQLTSEGVLVQDNQRFAFGHESFFDYCFARWFVAQEGSLVEFLVKSEQHLFRRAQVRQVLAYLRDANRPRYLRELNALFKSPDVRVHLKDVALALLANVSDPSDEEWVIWRGLVQPFFDAWAAKATPPNDTSRLAWQHLFGATSWFPYLDSRGVVAPWLEDVGGLMDLGLQYVRWHQRHSPDAVVQLLKPFIGRGGDWKLRLANVVSWTSQIKSRAYFDFILTLVDDGTLDEARSPLSQNGTFWSMFHSLPKEHPDWVAELLAHWLTRRLVLALAEPGGMQRHRPFGRDTFAARPIQQGADEAPQAFVKHVLPVALEISDAGTPDSAHPPKRDATWAWSHKATHGDETTAIFDGLMKSLSVMAADPLVDLTAVIQALKERQTHFANALLLTIYTAGASRFADEAAALLASEAWRLNCGYTDSPRWIAVMAIKAIAPLCSAERRRELEAVLLAFTSPYEQSEDGGQFAGHASFTLLSAIPDELRSDEAKAQFQASEAKFGKPDREPRGVRGGVVGSPIKNDIAEILSDDEWLTKISEYNKDGHSFDVDDDDRLTGGALEVARQLGALATKQPERFAVLAQRFPSGTHHYYFSEVLRGIEKTEISTDIKLDACRAAYKTDRIHTASAIAHVLAQLKDPLPADAVEMLTWIATEHPDPEREMWQVSAGDSTYYNGEIYTCGINTARGAGVMAIGSLIQEDSANTEQFATAIDRMIVDPSACVRSCVAYVLRTIGISDVPRTLSLLLKMPLFDDRELATDHVVALLQFFVRDHYQSVLPILTRMMQSSDPEVSTIAGRVAAIAALFHDEAKVIEVQALAGNAKQRLGVAEVAAANVAQADWRAWCEDRLLQLFDDPDEDVRRQATTCFRNLAGESLTDRTALIEGFCGSKAFEDDSSAVLDCLEQSPDRLPGITCTVCETFLDRFGDQANDWRSRRMGDGHAVTALLFRTYQQHLDDDWTKPCLDLIDRLCLDGWADVKEALDAFER